MITSCLFGNDAGRPNAEIYIFFLVAADNLQVKFSSVDEACEAIGNFELKTNSRFCAVQHKILLRTEKLKMKISN